MNELEELIEYGFSDRALLENALTHSSYVNENRAKRAGCYERLEFLGDSVLGMLTADKLYKEHGAMSEGELTRRRAMMVCEPSLAQAAHVLSLGDFIRFGRGEELSGGRFRQSILADVVEAVTAAVYLDGGLEAARRFARNHIFSQTEGAAVEDYKTALQERVQAVSTDPIAYHMAGESGPDHNKRFTAEVHIGGRVFGRGEGVSKKDAEQAAAREALKVYANR
ncbi:MAG: ribonuclease III [Oscillospiraceae bacterium]|nr:ribonuclease III [Oscillospiraceae bacterium]